MYGLLKLTLAKILPNWVEKAIVLDTDVIFATDISKLWNIFRQEKFVLFNCLHPVSGSGEADWWGEGGGGGKAVQGFSPGILLIWKKKGLLIRKKRGRP